MTAYCQCVGIPIYFEFLDNNSGNSHKVIVAGVRANIAMKQLKDGDFLILFGEGDPKKLPILYRQRWSI